MSQTGRWAETWRSLPRPFSWCSSAEALTEAGTPIQGRGGRWDRARHRLVSGLGQRVTSLVPSQRLVVEIPRAGRDAEGELVPEGSIPTASIQEGGSHKKRLRPGSRLDLRKCHSEPTPGFHLRTRSTPCLAASSSQRAADYLGGGVRWWERAGRDVP
jgi:hypothetical protein